MNRFFKAAVLLALPLAACQLPQSPSRSPRTIVVWEQEDAAVAPYIDSVFEAFIKLPGNAG